MALLWFSLDVLSMRRTAVLPRLQFTVQVIDDRLSIMLDGSTVGELISWKSSDAHYSVIKFKLKSTLRSTTHSSTEVNSIPDIHSLTAFLLADYETKESDKKIAGTKSDR